MHVPVKSFKIDHASMEEGLFALRSSDVDHIVIGFEELPHLDGEAGGPISITLTGTTVGEVVQRLCRGDPRYGYRIIGEGAMVEIRPKASNGDPNDLLNFRVHDYSVDADIMPAQAIEHIGDDASSLKEFLRHKAEEWSKRTGETPGSPGSILSGNAIPPRFTLHLKNITVCQILITISLKSIQIFRTGPNFDRNGMRLGSAPVGWKYEFLIDPNAPTGLGGYPKWTAF